jgi:hypothetical protein
MAFRHCRAPRPAGQRGGRRADLRYPSRQNSSGDEVHEEAVYQVVLEGRQVGPYDRRTIVGMRIRKTLTSDSVLIASDGSRLTVADLVKARPRDNSFQPGRSGSYSLVQATYSASLLEVEGAGQPIPAFKGEIEARVQGPVLRLAGRFRHGFGWKEGRVKLPMDAIVHARVRSSLVDLWLRHEGQSGLQRLSLELFTGESAGEFVDWLPHATPWPGQDRALAAGHRGLWIAGLAGASVVVVLLVVLLVARRLH